MQYLQCWFSLTCSLDPFSALLCSPLCSHLCITSVPWTGDFAVGFVSGKTRAWENQSTEGENSGYSFLTPSSLFSVTFLTVAVFLQINTSPGLPLLQSASYHWSPCNNISSPCPLSSRSGNISSLLLVSCQHLSLACSFHLLTPL